MSERPRKKLFQCPFCLVKFDPRYWNEDLHEAHISDCEAPKPVIRYA